MVAAIAAVAMSVMAFGGEAAPPMMGWASWNTYRVNISDKLIMHQADLMKELGLDALGYTFVNIDDGWFGGRDESGKLKTHSERFLEGLKCVTDHIHSLGLKAGIYSDGGENTCGSYYDDDKMGIGVGLLGHDDEDCRFLFGESDFDFIKVDFCGGTPCKNFDRVALDHQTRYTEIRQAMDKVRPGLRLNICCGEYPGAWSSGVAESWRISHDVRPRWDNIKDIIKQNLYLSAYASPGHYNDMDMLEAGRGMSEEEDHTHFAVWCFQSSPLMIGCDLKKLKDRPKLRALLTNRDYIALNQDIVRPQGEVIKRDGDTYVLVRDVGERFGTKRAVLFLNLEDEAKEMQISLEELELAAKDNVKMVQAQVPAHGARIAWVEGEKRLERTRYEAEWAFIPDYQELHDPMKSGTGFYKEVAGASGGMVASNCRRLVWRNVWSENGGEYEITAYSPDGGAIVSFARTLAPGEDEIKIEQTDSLQDIDFITIRKITKE